jgi:uncharacterized membrane protein YhhN
VIGWIAAAATAIAAGATVILEPRSRRYSRIAKAVAATGFIVVAISAGALDTSFGTVMLAGLVLSWIGDLALSYTGERAFLLGLGAFLLAHVAYTGAFAVRGVNGVLAVVAVIAAVLLAASIVPWLMPHVSDAMRGPVVAYLVVISIMLITATGTHGDDTDWRIVAGAGLFYASDIFVARQRFVTPSPFNRRLGLPLYFGGQLLLAWAAGG